MTDKKTQKILHEEYRQALSTAWKDPKMIDFCVKNAEQIVKLTTGGYVEIEKPRIESSFCFGYHDSAYNTESYDEANAAARHAAESESYFLRENMKDLEEKIFLAKTGNNGRNSGEYKPYVRTHYISDKTGLAKYVEWLRDWDLDSYHNPEALQPMTAEDRKAYIEALEAVKANFEKRLRTYLKRYGMSKVRTWSYWMDE